MATELRRGDVVKEFEANSVRMRDVFLNYTGVVLRDGTRQMSVGTEWFNECGICGAAEWVDHRTKEAWRTSALRFLHLQYCPAHAHLAEELDKTLRQTFRAQARDIVRSLAERLDCRR